MKPLTLQEVVAVYPPMGPYSKAKIRPNLDKYSRQFIGLSPFCVLSTADAEGRQDVTPRGGTPGFVRVLDDNTIMMPDRPGNNILDSLRNLTTGPGRVGLLFFIPGFDETLRVNGRAEVLHDAAMCEDYTEFGKPARSVLRIAVEEAYLHCGKALMRSRLWEADAQQDRMQMPSISDIIKEQADLDRPSNTHEQVLARNRDSL